MSDALVPGPNPSATAELPIRPLEARRKDWRPWVGALVSVGLVSSVLWQLRSVGPAELGSLLRLSPAFWAVFALLYAAQTLSEMVIFGRLWGLPLSGAGVLLRKNVINEIVLGYSGEVYFYLWARARTRFTHAPFGAIKDVNILSALAGNVVTLGMLALAAPAMRGLDLGRYLHQALWSGAGVVAFSLAILVFARRVFSLGRRDLMFVTAVHSARLLATTGLTALLWHLALPHVPLGLWMIAVALRLLISRLPFLTNKDLVFANVVFVVLGPHADVSVLLGTVALVTLLAHLLVAVVLTRGGQFSGGEKTCLT